MAKRTKKAAETKPKNVQPPGWDEGDRSETPVVYAPVDENYTIGEDFSKSPEEAAEGANKPCRVAIYQFVGYATVENKTVVTRE